MAAMGEIEGKPVYHELTQGHMFDFMRGVASALRAAGQLRQAASFLQKCALCTEYAQVRLLASEYVELVP